PRAEDAYVASGTVTVEEATPNVSRKMPVSTPVPRTAGLRTQPPGMAPSSPYGTYSRPPSSAPQPVWTPSPMPSAKLSAAQLKQRLESVCGPVAKGIEVKQQPDNSLAVRVKVRTAQESEAVAAKILAMPEMIASGATLKMQVEP